jgi:hypothetical protein
MFPLSKNPVSDRFSYPWWESIQDGSRNHWLSRIRLPSTNEYWRRIQLGSLTKLPFSEADTRAKLIDPAIHDCGWTEDLIRREETAGAIEIVDGKPRKRAKGRVDYTLRIKVNIDTQPVAVALIEAKGEHLPPTHKVELVEVWFVF